MANLQEAWEARWEAKQAEKMQKVGEQLPVAAGLLRTHIVEQNPELLVFTGRSEVVSRTVVGNVNRATATLVVFPPDLNESLYSGYSALDTEPQARANMKRLFPNLRPNSRMLIVDDHSQNGEKLRRIPIMMRELGFGNVNQAVLVANPKIEEGYLEGLGVFVASKAPELYEYIERVAGSISGYKRGLEEGQPSPDDQKAAKDFIQTKLAELKRLSR